jgi:hypothetical protein
MNTLLDLLKFNRECASRHIINSNRRWWIAGLAAATVFVTALVCVRIASATPSTTYWAPSVATCQAKYVPHITYDTYYGKGTPPPGLGAPTYPIDTGLTMWILPFIDKALQPGGKRTLWTTQLDVDIPLGR